MMPQLGETVTEGTITRWMKAVGDAVERDEPLFEVSTDKVDSEVPSPAAGVLTEILVPEGETVEVGVKLAVIGDGAGAAPVRRPRPPPAAPAPHRPGGRGTGTPLPRRPAPRPLRAGTGRRPRRPLRPLRHRHLGGREQRGWAAPSVLSPMVRKLLAENGISEAEVTGTGSGGRITRDDALRAVEARHSGRVGPAAARGRTTATAGRAQPSGAAAPRRWPGRRSAAGLDGVVPCRR